MKVLAACSVTHPLYNTVVYNTVVQPLAVVSAPPGQPAVECGTRRWHKAEAAAGSLPSVHVRNFALGAQCRGLQGLPPLAWRHGKSSQRTAASGCRRPDLRTPTYGTPCRNESCNS